MSAKSLAAFSDFANGLTGAKKNKNDSLVFNAAVEYSWAGRKAMETLEVRLHRGGIEHGKITVNDGQVLKAGLVYFDFDPGFQEYQLKGGSLVIRGTGPRTRGPYTVVITEV